MSTLQSAVDAPQSIATVDRGLWVVRSLWLGLACSLVGMAVFTPFGCDDKDYLSVISNYSVYVYGQGTYSVAYSPLFIIPTAGLVRLLPLWLTIALYGIAYFSGMLTELWVGMQFATPAERKILRYVAPVIAFFPGLLIADAIAAGNMAYILYGLVLAAAAWGWKRERWNWFYLAVLAVACVKVHMLTLLAIPLLCGRRQWMRAVATGVTGLAIYVVQGRIWPRAFHVYVNTLKHMSQSKRDFGCGPAGNLARILQHFGVPHDMPCILFYVSYASLLLLFLLWLARLYHEKRICFESWAPVMLLGVVLLNPRIQSYDVAAVSLPMALVAWRALRGDGKSSRRAVLIGAAIGWLALNILVEFNEDWITVLPEAWKYVEMFLMLGVFAFGVRGLLREASATGKQQSSLRFAGAARD
jgi:hypothetical protein